MEESSTSPAAPEAPTPAEAAPAAEAPTPRVSFDHFAAVQLRVGLVENVEAVPKSKKLLKLRVNLGEAEPRQILAGIAPYYTPETLTGKRVIVVANLEPAKLMGLESQGMLLAVQNADQSRVEVLEAPEGYEPGSIIR